MGEIYGTDVFEAGKDKIKALMDTLITNMAADDPKISAAYDYPNIINPTFNAVSVHLVGTESLDPNSYSQTSLGNDVLYEMTFAMRIHIAHVGGAFDSDKIARLMNSVNNKLHKNKNLGDKFRIKYTSDFKFNEEFELSDTIGGEFMCVVHKYTSHTQE